MYKGLLTSVRALQLLELKLSGSMANIPPNIYFNHSGLSCVFSDQFHQTDTLITVA